MGLREKVAEALINVQACSDTGQVLPAERYADAVMEVVEAENYGIDTIMEQLRKDIEERRAQLAKLRALHTKVDGGVFVDKCTCKLPWPCPTAEILEDT